MPSKELSTISQLTELTPPVPVPTNSDDNEHEANGTSPATEPDQSGDPLPQLEPIRELTQTDHLNKRLLKSFLAHINATSHVMEHFEAHVPNATQPGVANDDFEEQLFFGTQIM